MHFVYLIRSLSNPTQHYVGRTENLETRMEAHNLGESKHTSKFTPWKYIVTVGFEDGYKADAFEKYLKSGSGQAFVRRHFR